jgi:hypothetical protein
MTDDMVAMSSVVLIRGNVDHREARGEVAGEVRVERAGDAIAAVAVEATRRRSTRQARSAAVGGQADNFPACEVGSKPSDDVTVSKQEPSECGSEPCKRRMRSPSPRLMEPANSLP